MTLDTERIFNTTLLLSLLLIDILSENSIKFNGQK